MSLQDMIILQNKCEELEEKLAVAEKRVSELDGNYDFCLEQESKTLARLEIAIEALEYYADVNSYTARECECTYVAEEALEKIKG